MIYDVIIIGGGPAGMIAAGRAGERGLNVLLLEKNNLLYRNSNINQKNKNSCAVNCNLINNSTAQKRSRQNLGIKLLITGHGRCNLTNISADDKQKINVYGQNYKFLFSSFSRFGVDRTMDFFTELGVDLKVENNGRVFPCSDKASDIQSALFKYLKKNNVEIKFGAKVVEIKQKNKKITKIVLDNNEEISCKNLIIATGGKSYPQTGSTGDGYSWLKNLGHSVDTPRPALTPIVVEEIIKELEGLSFENVGINVYLNNKKVISRSGDMIFTADGVSGPVIIDLSKKIGEFLSNQIEFRIDFLPEIEIKELETKIQKDFHQSNKILKNYLSGLTSPKFAIAILKLLNIDEQKPVNSITKTERKMLVDILKEFTLKIKGLKGFDRAMITAGGVDVREVDPKTMRSRLYENLFFAGEILNLDGPTGGYNLQICWSTGYVAGDSVSLCDMSVNN